MDRNQAIARMGSLRLKRNSPVLSKTTIGFLTGGGYFQSELKSLYAEISQFEKALGEARGIGADGKPTPLTSLQDSWWKAIWLPFFRGWDSFHTEYATGWKSAHLPIVTSRLRQLEEWRRMFIALRKSADTIFPSPLLKSLPEPTPVKTYPSWLDEMADTAKRGLLWTLFALAALLFGFILYRRYA